MPVYSARMTACEVIEAAQNRLLRPASSRDCRRQTRAIEVCKGSKLLVRPGSREWLVTAQPGRAGTSLRRTGVYALQTSIVVQGMASDPKISSVPSGPVAASQ